jgi:DNA-binding MarR family transcriptional regulator
MCLVSEGDVTPERIRIAVLLLGLDREEKPRTQSEVCSISKLSKSTVSSHVARLLSSDFITKLTNGRLNILYGRGRRYAILESQINGRILAEMAAEASNTLNEGAVTGSEQKVAPPITFRVHIPGAWCKFRVEKEGLIEEAKFKEGFPPQTIFGKNGKAKNIRGSENWYGSFVMAKEGATMKYQLRYQRGKTSCFFYISIEEGLLVGRYDVLDVEIVKRKFLAACFPMLAWLEKHAEWRFEKDGTGNYVMLNEFTKDRLHFAGVGPLFDKIIDCCGGEKFGVSGETGAWIDSSPGPMEVEFGSEQYVAAVMGLPKTSAEVEALKKEQQAICGQITEIKRTLNESLGIVGQVVRIQNMSVKSLMAQVQMNEASDAPKESTYVPSVEFKSGGMYG